MQVDKLSPPILMLSEVSYRYNEGSRTIFSGVDLSATMESRICIVGENGAGMKRMFFENLKFSKTTFIKVSVITTRRISFVFNTIESNWN